MVAISSAFSAVMISGSRCTPLCSSAANFIAWSIEWFDDDAGPSEASPTVIPRRCIAGTGAKPDPR